MNTQPESHPTRKHLSHHAPVRASQFTIGAPYFITICVNRQHYGIPVASSSNLVGRVVLNAPKSASTHGGLGTSRPTIQPPNPSPLIAGNTAIQLLLALEHYRANRIIFPRIAVVMPDHIHFIASFAESSDMALAIRNWKRWTARETGVVWQDGFFDHRLRNDSDVFDKSEYITNNPVRKGLCENSGEWPFRMSWK